MLAVRIAMRVPVSRVSRQLSTSSQDWSKCSDAELDAHHRAIVVEKQRRQSTLIIGAAGAIGKRLCAALTARGHRVIATDRMETLSGSLFKSMGDLGTCVGSIDVRDANGLKALFKKYADANTTVWNLAAPLSVETALDPAVAEAVTVGGMRNVLAAMAEVGAKRICFTDSIGSFGASAPRRGATARWLVENPTQDPGSDYGRQKRACRELMSEFRRNYGGDSRFAVLPGVLHTNSVWGNGTTEYALDALLTAPHQATRHGLPTADAFLCPIDPDIRLPMIFSSDLMRGLVSLQEADPKNLQEPQCGYAIPGLSFTANELFAEIRKHHPGFGYRVPPAPSRCCPLVLFFDRFTHLPPLRCRSS
jgi:threonine 3-dehydrogenase